MRPSSQKLLSKLATLPHFEQLSRSRADVTTFLLRYSCLRPLKHSILLPSSLLARSIMTDQMQPPITTPEQPWYAAYPQARSSPESISRSKVLELFKQGKEAEKFILVDLRRTDYEACANPDHMTLQLRIALYSDRHYRAALSKAPSTCQPKASTQRSHRSTPSSRLPAFVLSSGIAVSLPVNVIKLLLNPYLCETLTDSM